MGLFDFVREAGERLGIVKDEEQKQLEEHVAESQKANALWHKVRNTGLDIEDLKVTYDDGTATVYGTTETQSEREKVILAIGNTEGVARVDDRIEVNEPAEEATFYTVESGDTLSGIAKEHYGDPNRYMAIFEANQPMLKDPDLIYPGQVLRIPAL